MKVKTLLNKMVMTSAVDCIRIERNGYTKVEYDEADLSISDYGFWGNENVKTFRIIDSHYGIVLVLEV